MDKRIIIFLVLSMALIVLYPYVMEKLGVMKRSEPAKQRNESADPLATATPVPPAPMDASTERPPAALKTPSVLAKGEVPEQDVLVETDLVKIVLSNRGAVVKQWQLKRYRESIEKDAALVELVPPPPANVSMVPPLAVQVADPKLQLRLAQALYKVSSTSLMLNDNQPTGSIDFSYVDPQSGVRIEKRLTFANRNYLVDLKVERSGITGLATLSLGTNFGVHKWEEGFVGFIGPATLVNGKLDKSTPDKEEIRTGQVSWAALQDKYFLAAAIPADALPHQVVIRKDGDKLVTVGLQTQTVTDTVVTNYRLFVGPKEYDTLRGLGIGVEDTIDFGWFIYGSWAIVRAVAKPLFFAMKYLYGIFHNYGVVIIVLTVGIKLVLAPLAYKSYKSMKQMAAVQPELQALQKKYAEDRERLNKELIKLYKDKKVNPVGGCLPMFIQIPVFVALFNILYMTIELRQAPFMLWIKDLSVQDPYYVLPILMGVTMFIQQKIQPTTMDPKQAQIMLILPVFLTFLFITFPAGLVLYWLTNNVLTILQQVITDRYLLPRPAPVPAT